MKKKVNKEKLEDLKKLRGSSETLRQWRKDVKDLEHDIVSQEETLVNMVTDYVSRHNVFYRKTWVVNEYGSLYAYIAISDLYQIISSISRCELHLKGFPGFYLRAAAIKNGDIHFLWYAKNQDLLPVIASSKIISFMKQAEWDPKIRVSKNFKDNLKQKITRINTDNSIRKRWVDDGHKLMALAGIKV